MNIVLEQTEEYVGGKKQNTFGDAFIRGNNGITWFLNVFIIYLFYVLFFL